MWNFFLSEIFFNRINLTHLKWNESCWVTWWNCKLFSLNFFNPQKNFLVIKKKNHKTHFFQLSFWYFFNFFNFKNATNFFEIFFHFQFSILCHKISIFIFLNSHKSYFFIIFSPPTRKEFWIRWHLHTKWSTCFLVSHTLLATSSWLLILHNILLFVCYLCGCVYILSSGWMCR